MGRVKEAMYHTILFQQEIEETEIDECIPLSVAREMLQVISNLEYELALYHVGCSKEEVNDILRRVK